jgi:hypothetical protein
VPVHSHQLAVLARFHSIQCECEAGARRLWPQSDARFDTGSRVAARRYDYATALAVAASRPQNGQEEDPDNKDQRGRRRHGAEQHLSANAPYARRAARRPDQSGGELRRWLRQSRCSLARFDSVQQPRQHGELC